MAKIDVDRLALIGRAISDPNRIRILVELYSHPMTTLEIIESIGLNQSNLSYHMSKLLRSGLVVCTHPDGRHVYELTSSGIRLIKDSAKLCTFTNEEPRR